MMNYITKINWADVRSMNFMFLLPIIVVVFPIFIIGAAPVAIWGALIGILLALEVFVFICEYYNH